MTVVNYTTNGWAVKGEVWCVPSSGLFPAVVASNRNIIAQYEWQKDVMQRYGTMYLNEPDSTTYSLELDCVTTNVQTLVIQWWAHNYEGSGNPTLPWPDQWMMVNDSLDINDCWFGFAGSGWLTNNNTIMVYSNLILEANHHNVYVLRQDMYYAWADGIVADTSIQTNLLYLKYATNLLFLGRLTNLSYLTQLTNLGTLVATGVVDQVNTGHADMVAAAESNSVVFGSNFMSAVTSVVSAWRQATNITELMSTASNMYWLPALGASQLVLEVTAGDPGADVPWPEITVDLTEMGPTFGRCRILLHLFFTGFSIIAAVAILRRAFAG